MDKMGKLKRCNKHESRFLNSYFVLMVMPFMFFIFIAICTEATAFEIPTGNEDIKIRWDNSFRLNLGYRIKPMDNGIANNPNLDDGDRNFAHGFVQSRLDLLSELDVVFKKNYGLRLSGAAWYDQSYHNGTLNDSLNTSNHFTNGVQSTDFNDYVKRRYGGPDAELLDAFVFGNFTVMFTPMQAKLGRHSLYFGESLGITGCLNGIATAQSPLDLAKGYAVPNVSAKEVFRPLNSISLSVQPLKNLSITGQYFLEFEPNKYPEAGSYLGIYDYLMAGAESILDPALGVIGRRGDIKPSNYKDYGIAVRWSPDILDGTLGIHFRNFTDKFPTFHISVDPLMEGLPAEYRMSYPSDIRLYGVSLSKQILGVSVGAEFSYRENMPFASDAMLIASDTTAAVFGLSPGTYRSTLPGSGETWAARGNSFHGLLNFLGTIPPTPLFDTAAWQVELNWTRYDRVTQNEQIFKGRTGYDAVDRVTKDAFAVDLYLGPSWLNVLPEVNLTMPIAFGMGLSGNSAASGIICERGGYWSVGLSADIASKYRVDLTYVDYFGLLTRGPNGDVIANNGDNALLSDRGTLSLTLRATF